jgi:hypothetical protein
MRIAMPRHSVPIALAFALSMVLFSGCGGSGNYVWVTGRLLKGGVPYKAPEGQSVTLAFYGIETLNAEGKKVNDAEAHQAVLDETDGSFKVIGPEGQGIPPGKYRVAVTQRYSREAFEALKDKPKGLVRDDDLLKEQFGPKTSPIVREVNGPVDLVIDLDKPTEGAPAGG